MQRYKNRWAIVVLCLALLSLGVLFLLNHSSPAFSPKKNDRIVILGNTFADRMRHYGYLEVLLQKNYPDLNLSIRNMGWSADEVGLQPRPLNFPGIKREIKQNVEDPEDLSFRSWGEAVQMPVALNFEGLHQDLEDKEADIIFLCFGLNEAFKGEDGLPRFEEDYNRFISELKSKKYNGHSRPTLILVSPIAHEKLGGHYPDPATHNYNLELYTRKIQKIAEGHGLLFVDLFTPSSESMAKESHFPLTINGIHLNNRGYQEAARWMAAQLGLKEETLSLDLGSDEVARLKKAIKLKDDHFFYRWRAVNGEYIYGRRREPFGILSYPPEMAKLDEMVASLDSVIWELAKEDTESTYRKALAITDESDNPDAQKAFLVTGMTGRQSRYLEKNTHQHHEHEDFLSTSTNAFTLPDGYRINLFASEKDFPIANPVAMAFDPEGRLWVATMPTYPQQIPGVPVHDKLIILEDTDGDGVADKHTVFADDLYLPLGFELGNGGVYVSQEPDLVFLKDTDGDGKADLREVVLTGFGSEDSHHAIHTFSFGPDGALYFNEGTFLNSQIETPHGPVRSYEGATYRFEPRTGKLEHYISYPYYNPWGNVFDRWGTHLVGDASDGSNYFAPPITGKVDYPNKHPRMNTFTTTRVRPTAGLEILSSRHFPDRVQGNLLINNTIGFQGIKQHQVLKDGAGLTSKEVEPLLQSSDPAFRPVDLEFGPDGALYLVDWYNPVISHGENPPRDPARDKVHGRIWRITHKDRPLLNNKSLAGKTGNALGIAVLLDELKVHEDRHRYRARMVIREMPSETVLPALEEWVRKLDKTSKDYELHLLEALWIYQDFNTVNEALLKNLLNASDYRARAAAIRILRTWANRIPDVVSHLAEAVMDDAPGVRLEAAVALSHFPSEEAVQAVCGAFHFPTDYFLDYALKETFKQLKPVWLRSFAGGSDFWEANPKPAAYALDMLSSEELLALPENHSVLMARLVHQQMERKALEASLQKLSDGNGEKAVEILLNVVTDREKSNKGSKELVKMLLSSGQEDLLKAENSIIGLTQSDGHPTLQSIGYAALLTARTDTDRVWREGQRSPQKIIALLNGVAMIDNEELKSGFYQRIKALTSYRSENQNVSLDIQEAAHTTLFGIVGYEEEKADLLSELVYSESPYLGLVHGVVSSAADSDLREYYAKPILQRILSYATSAEDAHRYEPVFNQMLSLGKTLLQFIDATERGRILAVLDREATVEMSLTAVPAKMVFDKDELVVKAGQRASLLFKNPDLMPHNVVFVMPGTADKVGDAAQTMGNGFEKHFVPDMPEVLFATPLIEAEKEYYLHFKAPDIPGEYPFICSFPGHWSVMRGILKVSE